MKDKREIQAFAENIVGIARENLANLSEYVFLTEIDLVGEEQWDALDCIERLSVERILPAAIEAGMLYELTCFNAGSLENLYYLTEF